MKQGFEAWFQDTFSTTMSSYDLLLWIGIIILIVIVFALSIGWIAYAVIKNNKHSREIEHFKERTVNQNTTGSAVLPSEIRLEQQ
jgi:hypothetical protein